MLVSQYKITIKEEPQFTGETFEERKTRILSANQTLTLSYVLKFPPFFSFIRIDKILLRPSRVPLTLTRRWVSLYTLGVGWHLRNLLHFIAKSCVNQPRISSHAWNSWLSHLPTRMYTITREIDVDLLVDLCRAGERFQLEYYYYSYCTTHCLNGDEKLFSQERTQSFELYPALSWANHRAVTSRGKSLLLSIDADNESGRNSKHRRFIPTSRLLKSALVSHASSFIYYLGHGFWCSAGFRRGIINREGRASPAGHLGERFGIVCICTVIHRPMIYTVITSHTGMNIF